MIDDMLTPMERKLRDVALIFGAELDKPNRDWALIARMIYHMSDEMYEAVMDIYDGFHSF